jgi:Asp-tRNA(Asn)/Glu-tRNA(Gln) amidotransferase A subunit family amidase
VGKALGETDILRAAAAFEAARPWADKRPPLRRAEAAAANDGRETARGREFKRA